jgi:hypothetical protein
MIKAVMKVTRIMASSGHPRLSLAMNEQSDINAMT